MTADVGGDGFGGNGLGGFSSPRPGGMRNSSNKGSGLMAARKSVGISPREIGTSPREIGGRAEPRGGIGGFSGSRKSSANQGRKSSANQGVPGRKGSAKDFRKSSGDPRKSSGIAAGLAGAPGMAVTQRGSLLTEAI